MARKPPKLPKGLLADFVRKHYAAPLQQGAFKKFRANKDLVPIKDAAGGIRLTTSQQRQQRPDIFLNEPGVIGGFRNPNPALNPSQWETAQNRVGITYARPRTEFTGLDPQSVADIKAFDALTEAQAGRVGEAYSGYATEAGADRDRAAQALGDLARLAGSGFSAPQGLGLSNVEMALPGVTAQTAAGTDFARSAQTLADMSALPTVARSEGAGAMERFRSERLGQRQDMLTSIREAQAQVEAEAIQAQMAAEQDRRELAAQIRGQNLDLLGALGGQGTDLQEAILRSNTDLAEAQLRSDTDLAGISLRGQQDALGDQFRNPRQLRTGGFTLGPWKTKPKPRSGITYEQGTDGRWYGKPSKGSSAAPANSESRTRALADIRASLGQRIDVEGADGVVTGQRGLSAYEIAADIASEYDVPIAWAYDQARKAGFHHRDGEWRPSKWNKTGNTARVPWKPGSISRAQLG